MPASPTRKLARNAAWNVDRNVDRDVDPSSVRSSTGPSARRPSRSSVRPALFGLLGLTVLLAGCSNLLLLSPHGDIAAQQGKLIMTSVWLMLLIIIPVVLLTFWFAWKYRAGNKDARYEPDWDHSIQLELIIWAAPLVIIIALGAITWINTHTLDPYRPLARISEGENLPVNDDNVLRVQVVALDWKWLFIYPDHGIAVVNELAAPVDRQIRFQLTSSSVMNSFYVPALAGQIYAMPAMESKLHAVINKAGSYEGFSANYSGAGFSWMRFRFLGLGDNDFDKWVADNKAKGQTLDRAEYLRLEKPSEREAVRRYAVVTDDLFDAVVNRCVAEGTRCMRELMVIDAHGGLGPTGQARRDQLIAAGVLLEDICRPASSSALAPLLLPRPDIPQRTDFGPGNLPPRSDLMPGVDLAPRSEATDSISRAL